MKERNHGFKNRDSLDDYPYVPTSKGNRLVSAEKTCITIQGSDVLDLLFMWILEHLLRSGKTPHFLLTFLLIFLQVH